MNQLLLWYFYLEMKQLVVIDIDADCKVQALVSFVDYFEVVELEQRWRYLDEVSLLGITAHNHSVDLRLQSQPLAFVVVNEPFRQTGSAPPILQQNETNLNQHSSTILNPRNQFKYYTNMVSLSKNILRKQLRHLLSLRIKDHRYNPTVPIGLKLTSLLEKIGREKAIKIGNIGSYLPNPEKQICPPQLEGLEYSFPWFQKKQKGQRAPLMEFKVVLKNAKLDEKVYGITIPSKDLETICPPIVLVPLFGFSVETKHRIGYGAGYYDRYIEFSRKKSLETIFIGIASKFSLIQGTFWNEYDQPLDYIVTQEQIY